jgi:hypothetical protein
MYRCPGCGSHLVSIAQDVTSARADLAFEPDKFLPAFHLELYRQLYLTIA